MNAAIDKDCLTNLINNETGLLQGTVPEIIQALFETCGSVTPQALAAAKSKLEKNTCSHSKPVMTIFTTTNEHGANMAEAGDASETTPQLINIGSVTITCSAMFASDVRKWHGKTDAEKAGPTLKTTSNWPKKQQSEANRRHHRGLAGLSQTSYEHRLNC
jgi:hypothetical protein